MIDQNTLISSEHKNICYLLLFPIWGYVFWRCKDKIILRNNPNVCKIL